MEVLDRTGILAIHAMLRLVQLRWSGHLEKMDDDVTTGARRQGGQKRCKSRISLTKKTPDFIQGTALTAGVTPPTTSCTCFEAMQSTGRILTGFLLTVVLVVCGAAVPHAELNCQISESEALRLPKATLFVGIVDAVSAATTAGATVFVDVRVLEVFENRLGLTSAIRGHQISGILASGICAKNLRVGKQYLWVVTVRQVRNKLEMVLRTVGKTLPQTETYGRGNEIKGE
ncbi:unnamed protein product [Schistocephalus solidus]|uniref:Dirigent protein n=1 Tax=Schistocephalus solidus TaxID=70667 RepID=A0A183T2A9_SCHSO|nr:unnamed protein product [Schistocephalus solidus]